MKKEVEIINFFFRYIDEDTRTFLLLLFAYIEQTSTSQSYETKNSKVKRP